MRISARGFVEPGALPRERKPKADEQFATEIGAEDYCRVELDCPISEPELLSLRLRHLLSDLGKEAMKHLGETGTSSIAVVIEIER